MSDSAKKVPVVPRELLSAFILVTCLFALWGFANDVTNPLVKAFKDIFIISNAQSSWVQMAFYGGYATMALPAALFIRRFSYKAGILVGLSLYATGAMISIPAASLANFNLFLVALYVLTFGLAFLETTSNPYILSMGDEATATRRLNLAQSFNPMGSLTGMAVAIVVILSNLQVQDFRDEVQLYRDQLASTTRTAQQSAYQTPVIDRFMVFLDSLGKGDKKEAATSVDPVLKSWLDQEQAKRNAPLTNEQLKEVKSKTRSIDSEKDSLADISYDQLLTQALKAYKSGTIASFHGEAYQTFQDKDLQVVRKPYVGIGIVVIAFLIAFALKKMPDTASPDGQMHLGATFKHLFHNKCYIEGVLAQTFYVAAQILCWTFIIHYATDLLGFSFAKAQAYNIIAMIIFVSSRFICTFLLKYFSPGRLLMALAIGGIFTTAGAIFLRGLPGLYSLVAISACMSLMFPTIYGIALEGMGEEAKVASAGLIFAIVGGALTPPLQGKIIDVVGNAGGWMGLEGVRVSFFLPFICFVAIAIYGFRTFKVHHAVAGK